jgi:hypothetical protein
VCEGGSSLGMGVCAHPCTCAHDGVKEQLRNGVGRSKQSYPLKLNSFEAGREQPGTWQGA